MPQPELTFHKVDAMPPVPVPDGMYFVLDPDGLRMRLIVTTALGDPVNLVAGAAAFTQTFAEGPQWIVNHNLGHKPSAIAVLTMGGVEVESFIVHTSDNQFVVNLSPPMAGQVVVQ